MELDEHVAVYVPELKYLEYHVPSDDDMPVEDQPYADDASPIVESLGHIADSELMKEDSIDYPDEPEHNDEDPEKDPEEDHTDYPTDEGDRDDEPFDNDDDDDDDTDDEDREPTEDEDDDEEEEEHLAPTDSSPVPIIDLVPQLGIQRHSRLMSHRAAMIRMRDDIPEEDMPLRRKFVLTALLPGCDVTKSYVAARPPRGQYDFFDTIEAGHGLIRSPGHDYQTIARAADRAEDVGYVRALQASEHKMMTSIKEVNLRISYQAQVCRQESEDFYT
uniref:Uncharacterized protein n=1 Tax=Tanacetum cinerariifolium TaxID=118510 RepID=A0A699ISC9_TANCI|nr:hypothetical protein [Tanacetum cinerariifolium]